MVILAVLPEAMTDEYPSKLWRDVRPFDVLKAPLTPLDTRYRLNAAFSFVGIRATSRFFKTVASGIGAGLLVLDANQKILWINSLAKRLLGYQENDLEGRQFSHLIETSQAVVFTEDCIEPTSFRVRMTKRDGSRFWAFCLQKAICLSQKTAFTITFSDISSYKQREDELLLSAKFLNSGDRLCQEGLSFAKGGAQLT